MKTKEQIECECNIHVGDRFGDLTVVKFPVPLGDGESASYTGVECICKCGNTKVLTPYRLTSGDTKSCGCGRRKTGAYVGLRSGKLEIVKLFRKMTSGGNQLMAHVKCDCGNEKDLLATAIVQGRVSSCGCTWRNIPKVGDKKGHLEVTNICSFKDKFGSTIIDVRCGMCGKTIQMSIARWNVTKMTECVECRKQKNKEKYHSFIPKCKIGDVFGNLKVTSIEHKKRRWECTCECQCDKHTLVKINDTMLVNGKKRDCGCINRHIKHGDSRTRLYRIYKGMRDRCTNAKSYYYVWYGARGIKVCPEWSEWGAFKKWALCNGYNDSLSIDRINTNGDYSPENCKWSTTTEQNRNKRTTPHYEYNGKSMTIAEWERELGLPINSLRSRIRAGWNFDEAVTTPRFKTRGWRKREAECNG